MIDISVERCNFIANGLIVHNSSARFSRIREGLLNDWFKQVGEAVNHSFADRPEIIGIIISGPGPTKDDFVKTAPLFEVVRKKIIGSVDTSYTGEYGLEETLVRGEDLIKETAISKEKELLQNFFSELKRPGASVVYGIKETIDSMNRGILDKLILSEKIDYKKIEYECGCGKKEEITTTEKKGEKCNICGQNKRPIAEQDLTDIIEDIAAQFGTKVIVVSADTREGDQFLALGGIGGFLRYRV